MPFLRYIDRFKSIPSYLLTCLLWSPSQGVTQFSLAPSAFTILAIRMMSTLMTMVVGPRGVLPASNGMQIASSVPRAECYVRQMNHLRWTGTRALHASFGPFVRFKAVTLRERGTFSMHFPTPCSTSLPGAPLILGHHRSGICAPISHFHAWIPCNTQGLYSDNTVPP